MRQRAAQAAAARPILLTGAVISPVNIVAVVQDLAYPPRVLVTVTGLVAAGAASLTVYRVVGGVRTALRGADGVTLTGADGFVVVDAEQPFGVPVTYLAEVTPTFGGDIDVPTAASITITSVTKAVLSDAITGQAADVVVTAWAERRRSRAGTAFDVGGRAVVVSGPRSTARSAIELLTEYDSSRENLSDLLDSATGGVLQLRQPGGYSMDDAYIVVLSDVETRWSQDGTDQRRTWTLDVVEVEAWPTIFEARGYVLQDVADAYPGTLADLATAYPTLLSLAQADLG